MPAVTFHHLSYFSELSSLRSPSRGSTWTACKFELEWDEQRERVELFGDLGLSYFRVRLPLNCITCVGDSSPVFMFVCTTIQNVDRMSIYFDR